MNDGFAIAALSHVLRDLLAAFIEKSGDVTEIGAFEVTSRPQSALAGTAPSHTVLSIFPLVIERSKRGSDLPSRSPTRGTLPQARLHIEVTYLVTVFGGRAGHTAEVLNGLVALALFGTPVLTGDRMRQAAAGDFPANSPIPQALRNLADQEEAIRLRPMDYPLEESLRVSFALGCGLGCNQFFRAGPVVMRSPVSETELLPVLPSHR